MNNATKFRMRKALREGRKPHVDGHPHYLEENELKEFLHVVVNETLKFNQLSLNDLCSIVYFYFLLFF
jgi:hypothetical protein